jgi:uncharacterized membrane protein
MKTWHDTYEEARTAGERIADRIAAFVGSWRFVYLHVVWFGVWVLLPVETFPFGMLTMLVSLEAILLSTLIMMSQNRQSVVDRHQARADFETDTAAKEEIEALQKHLARIEIEKLDKILNILER